MTSTTTGVSPSHEKARAHRFFWCMLACFALAHLASRRLPVLEVPLQMVGFGAFLVACYYQLTDPGRPRGAQDGA